MNKKRKQKDITKQQLGLNINDGEEKLEKEMSEAVLNSLNPLREGNSLLDEPENRLQKVRGFENVYSITMIMQETNQESRKKSEENTTSRIRIFFAIVNGIIKILKTIIENI